MPRQIPYSVQAPSAVIMVRPHHFTVNAETAADNLFQSCPAPNDDLALAAYAEITEAADTLRRHGVNVHLFDSTGTDTPDAGAFRPPCHRAHQPTDCKIRRQRPGVSGNRWSNPGAFDDGACLAGPGSTRYDRRKRQARRTRNPDDRKSRWFGPLHACKRSFDAEIDGGRCSCSGWLA